MYDVIVVGAGPTGSTAAKVLAEKGLHVLLVERHKLPRYKSCSGVLIQKTMDLVRRYFGEDVPLSATCTPAENRGMIFTDDKGRAFRFEQGGLNVWRSSFDNWLTEQAAASGAEVRDSTSAITCEEQDDLISVTLRGKSSCTEQASYVVDCEGITGVLKRKLLGDGKDFITTFQTFNQGTIQLDPHYFYAYLQPELSEYGAWFNVKDEMLVLGVSVKDTSRIEHFYRRFISYMETHHGLQIEQQVKAEKWLMPHIRPGCPITYGQGRVLEPVPIGEGCRLGEGFSRQSRRFDAGILCVFQGETTQSGGKRPAQTVCSAYWYRFLFAGEIAGFLNPMGGGISAGIWDHVAGLGVALQDRQIGQFLLEAVTVMVPPPLIVA